MLLRIRYNGHMHLPLGLGRIDFTDWVRGVFAAFISGGASAVTSGVVVSSKDPSHYAPGSLDFFELVASVFFMNGLIGMMFFLREKPLPDIVTTTETELKTVRVGSAIPVATLTTKETTTIIEASSEKK